MHRDEQMTLSFRGEMGKEIPNARRCNSDEKDWMKCADPGEETLRRKIAAKRPQNED